MRALIVVESMFGNTRAVADAVAAGLATGLQVEVVDVGAPGTADTGADVLIVGGPTHAHGMTRPGTRKGALAQVGQPGGGTTGTGAGLREWLVSLDAGGHRPAAAFDTRFDKPRWLVGSAARGAARLLRRKGFRLAAPPESFYVTATKGPLADGELVRARAWGEHLGTRVSVGQGRGRAA